MQGSKDLVVNVGEAERVCSATFGGWFLLKGIKRFSVPGLALASFGYWLVRRGITGHCQVYQWMNTSTTAEPVIYPDMEPYKEGHERNPGFSQYSGGYESEPADAVEEGSMESFPASDAPSHGGASRV